MGIGDLWPDDLPDGARVELDQTPLVPQTPTRLPLPTVGEIELRIAKSYRVPYWLMSSHPRPSWLRRPIWRLRALWWGR